MVKRGETLDRGTPPLNRELRQQWYKTPRGREFLDKNRQVHKERVQKAKAGDPQARSVYQREKDSIKRWKHQNPDKSRFYRHRRRVKDLINGPGSDWETQTRLKRAENFSFLNDFTPIPTTVMAGVEVRGRRLALGLSTRDLAVASGIGRNAILNTETGKQNPRFATISNLTQTILALESVGYKKN